MLLESFTRLPAEMVFYAAREHPETPIGKFFERALRRVANSNVLQRKSLVAMAKPFTIDLASWCAVRTPSRAVSGTASPRPLRSEKNTRPRFWRVPS